jgi:hypothetical protein
MTTNSPLDGLEGLAEWLRADALDANPHNAAKLNRWADAVEALQYGNCSYWCPACFAQVSKPEHPVATPTLKVAVEALMALVEAYGDSERTCAKDAGATLAAVREYASALAASPVQPTEAPRMPTDAEIEFALCNQMEDPSKDEEAGFVAGIAWLLSWQKQRSA